MEKERKMDNRNKEYNNELIEDSYEEQEDFDPLNLDNIIAYEDDLEILDEDY